MSDIKVFRLGNTGVEELQSQSLAVERSLQKLIEKNLEQFFGVRLLASEYSTGKTHGGRIDSIGIDENGYPVIIEYKRALNENVINQGLFYLDWLMDHKGDFTLLVQKIPCQQSAQNIEWSSPRLLCIAGDFTKYDQHAVQQIGRNIELIRYRRYGDDLLLFELVNSVASQGADVEACKPEPSSRNQYKTVSEYLKGADIALRDLFESLKAYLLALGDDVQLNVTKFYFAFKRIKNFACVEVQPQKGKLLVYVKVDPDSLSLEPGFTRDVRHVGHFGTGDLEIAIGSAEDLEMAKPLILKSYEAS